MLNGTTGAHSPRKALFVLALVLFSTAGRSGTTEPPRVLSELNRANLGTIGVRMTPSEPETGLFDPFGYEESSTIFPAFILAGASGGVFGIGAALIGYPIAATINRIPEDKAAQIKTFAGSIFDQRTMQEDLRASVTKTAWTEAGVSIEVYEGASEDRAGEGCPPDDIAFDQILDLRLPRYVFAGTGGSDPSLALVLNVESRLIDAQTCNDLYADHLVYSSENRNFSTWSADRTLANDAVSRGLQDLAERIVEDLFLLYPSEDN